MSKAANRAKTKWNAENYKQVKVFVAPAIAAAFKAACETADISMASVLSQFMAQYSGALIREHGTCEHGEYPKPNGTSAKEGKPSGADLMSTRGKRRKLVKALLHQIEQIKNAEESYLSNIPENLQGSSRYEVAEESISLMNEVIELLGEIY